MTKAELIQVIADDCNQDKDTVGPVVESFFKAVKASMAQNEAIFVRGFGTFINKRRAKKVARNISKNTAIVLPAHYTPTFKPCHEFKGEVMKTVKVN